LSSENPPPVEYFRKTSIFDILIKVLFDFKSPLTDETQKNHFVFLLAYLATYDQNLSKEANTALLEDTMNSIRITCEVCEDKGFAMKMNSKIELLEHHLAKPIVAAGILHWVRLSLLDPSYYETTYHTVCTPVLLKILCEIATQHRLLQDSVFESLEQAFALPTSMDALTGMNFHRQILRCMVHLIHLGRSVAVFQMINSNFSKMDLSLVRYFILTLLETTGPPYSVEFADNILRIISSPGAERALRTNKQSQEIVQSFVVVILSNWKEKYEGSLQQYLTVLKKWSTVDQ
jgi:hypothetical protein